MRLAGTSAPIIFHTFTPVTLKLCYPLIADFRQLTLVIASSGHISETTINECVGEPTHSEDNLELPVPFLLIFIIVPVIELAVLIKVGSYIGVLWTVALILLTAFIGVGLLRVQGLATLMRASQRMQDGQLPARELAEGFLLAMAGALLLTPGFVTDAFGFALLVPGVRGAMAGSVMNMLKVRAVGGMGGMHQTFRQPEREVHPQRDSEIQHHPHRPEVIDGEYKRED